MNQHPSAYRRHPRFAFLLFRRAVILGSNRARQLRSEFMVVWLYQWRWKPFLICSLAGAAVLVCSLASRSNALADASRAELEAKEEQAIKQAAALVGPSLVRIETVGGLDRVGQVLTVTGPTTGLVVSPEGYVISSAFNFAARPASILVTLPDGRRLPAVQVATDKLKMLTLIKIEAENLPVPQPAPADSFHVGQWSIALGKTLDETPSISVGIVSALNRIWG